jgi:hypothetical protein
MKFVATKTVDQLDLQALHRVRERLVSQRTGIINQICAFLWSVGLRCARGPLSVHRIAGHPLPALTDATARLSEAASSLNDGIFSSREADGVHRSYLAVQRHSPRVRVSVI